MTERITTAAELDALPEQSVIRDKHADIGVLHLGQIWYPETAPLPRDYVAKCFLPATVLYRPDTEPVKSIAQVRADTAERIEKAISTEVSEYRGSVNQSLADGWRGGMANAADIAARVGRGEQS